ncbi:methyltransferase domain-containing protein [Streptomyces sp. NPDC101754]|uniref:methyltransferase domain-containing protein n=1 Tax=Streptomyces sp. NPDC101754 TaxID=3366145 RepID=UPI003806F8AB
MARERLWRGLTALYVALRAGEEVVDVGCGTGSLAVLPGRVEPSARIVGVDPAPEVLAIARRKAAAAGVEADGRVGRGDEPGEPVGAGTADTVVSGLVPHQCALPVKRAVLASIVAVSRPRPVSCVTPSRDDLKVPPAVRPRGISTAQGW